MNRPTKTEYGLALAELAASRSEDPRLKVGAVALDKDGRVLATAYNGLTAGMSKHDDWWKNESDGMVLHAEQNLAAHLKMGEAETVCLTHEPCSHCLRTLIALGIRKIYYRQDALETAHSAVVGRFYGVVLGHWPATRSGLSRLPEMPEKPEDWTPLEDSRSPQKGQEGWRPQSQWPVSPLDQDRTVEPGTL